MHCPVRATCIDSLRVGRVWQPLELVLVLVLDSLRVGRVWQPQPPPFSLSRPYARTHTRHETGKTKRTDPEQRAYHMWRFWNALTKDASPKPYQLYQL